MKKNKMQRMAQPVFAGQTRDQNANPFNLRANPSDPELQYALRQNLLTLSIDQLKARLARQVSENRGASFADREVPQGMMQRILDTGATSSGGVLPRVDLEQTIYALFVKTFPWFERIQKAPANGLRHTWNVAQATGAGSDGQLTASSDLANAQTDVGTYAQYSTVNIAIVDTLRGVSLKEMFAVQQSGMSYSPEVQEMILGTTRLKSLVQRLVFQGNQSKAAGNAPTLSGYPAGWTSGGQQTGVSEFGAAGANGFDGLRMITAGGLPGTYGAGTGYTTQYSTGAIAVDQDSTGGGGPFTVSQAVNYATAQIINNGGLPSVLAGSPIALNKLMNEQEGKQRTEQQTLVPGVQVPGINTTAGILPYVWAPGSGTGTTSALGNYQRASDGATVEDLYVLDENMLTLRYLGSPDISVIEIPVGVDTQLSRRFILYGMYGLQVADNGLFQAKVRLPL